MASQRPRRFWKDVSVVETAPGLYGVALDGRGVKTPGKLALAVPSRGLAQAIADEWDAVEKELDPAAMPMTQLVNTMVDRIGLQRGALTDELMRYIDADSVCYVADEPADLVARQVAEWGPVRAWVADRLGHTPVVTAGLMPEAQETDLHNAVRAALDAMDDATLTAFQVVAGATSSWCLGLAFVTGFGPADVIFRAACLDELFQAELWGEDWEAKDRRDALQADLLAAERFLSLARMG